MSYSFMSDSVTSWHTRQLHVRQLHARQDHATPCHATLLDTTIANSTTVSINAPRNTTVDTSSSATTKSSSGRIGSPSGRCYPCTAAASWQRQLCTAAHS
eukprot:359678-Chlamydomonas_euryale.AAC.2